MSQIITFNMLSLDGYFADADSKIDWHVVDDEFNQFAIDQIHNSNIDTLLFGRTTYQLFESFWPNVATFPDVSTEDIEIGRWINETKKIVVSSTLEEVTWQNSELLKGDLIKEITRLKSENKKNIMIFGSGTIVNQLAKANLIDEYSLMYAPVILGAGKSFFTDVNLKLQMTKTREFKCGNVLVHYTPVYS